MNLSRDIAPGARCRLPDVISRLLLILALCTAESGGVRQHTLSGQPGELLSGAARRYVEVHMEQGPVLESRGYAIGPVAAIAGQTRLAVSVEGTQVGALQQGCF